MRKIAVVLFNLGGPDSQASIRPFLKNFFMDKNIIQAPWLARFLISSLIANRRSKKEADTSYGALGHQSPLLENTRLQSAAIEAVLQSTDPAITWKTFIAMRYWHPMSDEAAKAVQAWQPDEIVLLPLYPQFSTTTTKSSVEDWNRAAKKIALNIPTKTICCYPFNKGFIQSSAKLIRASYDDFIKLNPVHKPRVLFSAHGLPEKIIQSGDPYQWQCEETAKKIAAATGIVNLDWQICYQSRVGPLKWIGPSTEDALRKAAKDGVAVLVYPHAFVSEHVETLVEIELEYRHLAKSLGIPGFVRVPTVSENADFIDGLVEEIQRARTMPKPQSVCPDSFMRCFCKG